MKKAALLSTLALLTVITAYAENLFENSDFETGTLKNWTAEGNAFKSQPTKGDNVTARGRTGEPSKHRGSYWIGTYEAYNGKIGQAGNTQGDDPTGKLTSTEFGITKNYINFLVGAGNDKDESVRLVVDGKELFLGTGRENESMHQVSADVSQFKGKKAKIMILDNASGGWGHINADDFTATDKELTKAIKPVEVAKVVLKKPATNKRKPQKPLSGPKQTAKMIIDKKFIIVPIDNNAAKTSLTMSVDDKEVRFVTGTFSPAADQTDWWAFFNVSEYKGKELTLTVGGIAEEGFKLIQQSDTVPGSDKWGDEPKRPQFHFSQKVGWNNDPNGMVYYDGEWHLYLQHNPVGLPWGNMTWAHGVTKDLCHWEQLPNVLHNRHGDAMFSGGGAVDRKNCGGWKTGKNDVIFITWTSTGRGECIAYSNDKGRTFTEYKGNPIIKNRGRDPKPFWYEYGKDDKPLDDAARQMGGHWVIAVFDENKDIGRNIAFYTSTDLKKWTEQSHLPGYFECPEVFQLPVDGNKNNKRWVIFGGNATYGIGNFDGKKFTPEHENKYQLHWGTYYASQCFSDDPNDRVVQIGWARIAMGDTCFNQTFSFPTELTLRTTEDGIRMFGEPVEEINKIHGRTHKEKNKILNDKTAVEIKTKGALFDIRATFDVGTAKQVGLIVDGKEAFKFDCIKKKINNKTIRLDNNKISVQILIDRPMKETFINNGEMIITAPYENDLNIESIKAIATGGEAKLVSFYVYELDASWK